VKNPAFSDTDLYINRISDSPKQFLKRFYELDDREFRKTINPQQLLGVYSFISSAYLSAHPP
jgi:hypothetical protein